MYFPHQIVWDLTTKLPVQISEDVWDPANYQHRLTHFLIVVQVGESTGYEIYLPQSITEAVDLLEKGIIQPAPYNWSTHCWKCHNWYTNHGVDGTCWSKGNL